MRLRLLVAATFGAVAMCPGPCATAEPRTSDGAVVAEYFDALARRDFDGAMSVRCRARRVGPAEEELFLVQVGLVTADYASIRPSMIEEFKSDWDLSREPLPVRAVYRYSFDTGRGLTEPSLMYTVIEDGAERICGWSAQYDWALLRTIPARLVDSGRNLTDLDSLPGPPAATFVLVDESSEIPAGGRLSAALAASSRGWQRREFGGVRITTLRFATSDDREAAGRDWIAHIVRDSAGETFDVEGWSGAVGVRHLAAAWTWAQTPSHGPMCDQVTAAAGDVLVLMTACGLAPAEDHSIVLDLAAQGFRTLS